MARILVLHAGDVGAGARQRDTVDRKDLRSAREVKSLDVAVESVGDETGLIESR